MLCALASSQLSRACLPPSSLRRGATCAQVIGASDEQLDVFQELLCSVLVAAGRCRAALRLLQERARDRDRVPFTHHLLVCTPPPTSGRPGGKATRWVRSRSGASKDAFFSSGPTGRECTSVLARRPRASVALAVSDERLSCLESGSQGIVALSGGAQSLLRRAHLLIWK